jgi:hypothetical protein
MRSWWRKATGRGEKRTFFVIVDLREEKII